MKNKHSILALATLAAIALGTASTFAGDEKDEVITLDKVPAAVHKTLAEYAQDSEVKKVEITEQDDKKVYEFDIEQGTKKFELTLSKKGKFVGKEEDIQLTDMPEAAQTALKAQAEGGKLSDFEKAEDAHHKITYEGVIEKNGKKVEVTVDAVGKVVSTEAVDAEKD